MALSDHGQYSGVVDIARNGIDEVIRLQTRAKQDTELIRQLVDALDEATTYTASAMWSPSMTNECKELAAKGRARLEGEPPQVD